MDCCWMAGRFPALDRMSFNRVIPSQHLLPAKAKGVTRREIGPPKKSEWGQKGGSFYLVSFSCGCIAI